MRNTEKNWNSLIMITFVTGETTILWHVSQSNTLENVTFSTKKIYHLPLLKQMWPIGESSSNWNLGCNTFNSLANKDWQAANSQEAGGVLMKKEEKKKDNQYKLKKNYADKTIRHGRPGTPQYIWAICWDVMFSTELYSIKTLATVLSLSKGVGVLSSCSLLNFDHPPCSPFICFLLPSHLCRFPGPRQS